jgi:hypothetical protein
MTSAGQVGFAGVSFGYLVSALVGSHVAQMPSETIPRKASDVTASRAKPLVDGLLTKKLSAAIEIAIVLAMR